MYEIFQKLCEEKGISAYKVCKETGITTATMSNWKAGRYKIKADKLQKIADYFEVSLEYLMTGKETTIVEDDFLSTLTPQEREKITLLYQQYQNASPEVRSAVEILLRAKSQES